MNASDQPIDRLLYDLKERAKELNCLYEIQELLNKPEISVDEICQGIVSAIPPGWQFPDVCCAQVILGSQIYQSQNFAETSWVQKADIIVQDEVLGQICVYYTEERPESDEGPFLKEERKLINTIADQFSMYILHQQLREVFEKQQRSTEEQRAEWWVILNMLKRTDPNLLAYISRKMINYLSWAGLTEAEQLLTHFSRAYRNGREIQDENRPFEIGRSDETLALSDKVFELAGKHLSKDVILEKIQQWIRENQSGFLVSVLVDPSSSVAELGAAIERYHHLAPQGLVLSTSREKSCKIALIRRLLSDQPEYIKVAKDFIEVDDFNDLIQHMIYPSDSHGKLGGKGAGLFVATHILEQAKNQNPLLDLIKTPKTWYIASDVIFHFMNYSGLEDTFDQKYKEINQIHQEYPYVMHVFKNSSMPPDIIKELSLALDDFGDVPLIVRSSSLLEDRMGMAFAGKYKSLFIANLGTKEDRLAALIDAITEVFASMFGPNPIEYRADHGLEDYHEEMGILIQEVVGTRVGHYYLPAFAGVAFSHNEFRWSSRIRRSDGLIRLVMGLGTRAVDRLTDDYPILVSPGQPNLRVNVSTDEILRYSPKKVDVINLQTGSFETIEIHSLLKLYGREYPEIRSLVSIYEDGYLRPPRTLGLDFDKDDLVITFEGLIQQTPFVQQIHSMLTVLQEKFNHPVDIEFAHDGSNIYLLQCRSQSYSEDTIPAFIPYEIPSEQVIFSANRYVSNGKISNITHVVYIHPRKYAEISSYDDLVSIGRIVGKLNQILPRRQFILMGPGRWGSRGDIKLGVNVTYSDIKNTAMLVEIASKNGDYAPDPSFGTHFFLDLVEASIRYLPLYPDDPNMIFKDEFFNASDNALEDFIPEYRRFSDVVRVIDIPGSNDGRKLTILMNAEHKKAVAILS